ALSRDPAVRGSLPLGVDVSDAGALEEDLDALRQALIESLATVPDSVIAAAIGGTARAAQRAGPLGPLAQLRAAREGVDRVELRAHLEPRLQLDPLRLVTRLGSVPLRAEDRPDVEKLIETRGPLTVST